MKQATLCFIIRDNKILLGKKKFGFGKDKYNGFGGKLNPNENPEQAAIRELFEESNLKASKITKVGEISYIFPDKIEFNQIVHIFLVDSYEGIEKETEEMLPKWFNIKEIPFNEMWDNDKYWIPLVLNSKKIKAEITQDETNTVKKEIKIVENFSF